MLQQTQVKTVLPYFKRFIERFPNVEALASAKEQEVLAAWSGLGYYRRAKALHRAAQWIVHENGGRLPETLEGWMRLPGVGRYTAGAVLSIAFGKRYPILDGNVARVLARVFIVRGDPRRAPVKRVLWRKAEEILPAGSISAFNQALMELGALVCTARSPRCLVCPISEHCGARREGLQEVLPESAARPASVPVTLAAAVIRRGGRLLMYRRKEDSLMQDLWELPGGACGPGEDPQIAVVREVRARYGIEVEPTREIVQVKHSIMNRRITLLVFDARLRSNLGPKRPGRAWVKPEMVARLPVSSMTLKVFRSLEPEGETN
jgi:A/G-specific adenine glycosylase